MSSQSTNAERDSLPRAVIHKQILEVAREQPNASIEDLAAEISGASADLVERVLEEHGDPAAPDEDADVSEANVGTAGDESNGAEAAEHESPDSAQPVFAELTENQQQVLREIKENPAATQTELAERLDLSQPTINSRLNSIEGFDWQSRHEFVRAMDDANGQPMTETVEQSTANGEVAKQLDELTEQVEAISAAIDEQGATSAGMFGDVELDCKVIRACLDADDITAAEADRVMKTILTGAADR